MPIEYAISKAGLNIMVRYFNQWSKYKKKNIDFFCISPAGVLDKQSKKLFKILSKKDDFSQFIS